MSLKLFIFLFLLECVCHILGTNTTSGPCDPESGQCPCYPNVSGKECDECQPEHWKIASGHGCEHCNCDSVGSTNSQCNPVSIFIKLY